MAEKRADLAALEVNDPFSYVGDKVFPTMKQEQKVDTVYHITPTADSSAQESRTLGTAPNSATMAPSSGTATCTEIIDRVIIPDDEIPRYGGSVDMALKLNAIVAKRNVMRILEARQVTEAESASIAGMDILGNGIRYAMDFAVDAVHTVPGRLCGVCGWNTFRRLTRYTEISNTLLRSILSGGETAAADVRQVSVPIVASILGLQELYVGDSDHWTDGQMTIFKQADPVMFPWMESQIGRTVTYWPEAVENPIEIETFYSNNLKSWTVDCRCWNVVKRFASRAGMFIIKGIDEGNTNTTTTTTTTTTT